MIRCLLAPFFLVRIQYIKYLYVQLRFKTISNIEQVDSVDFEHRLRGMSNYEGLYNSINTHQHPQFYCSIHISRFIIPCSTFDIQKKLLIARKSVKTYGTGYWYHRRAVVPGQGLAAHDICTYRAFQANFISKGIQ